MSALVIGVYSLVAHSGVLESPNPNPGDSYYNLLVQGFRAGQLSLKKGAPPGLAQLADPYDPAANAPYRTESYKILDLSYYKGRLYLYFGVMPALILFWPFAALTGHYLFHRQAVAIFCAVGFLASVGLLCALWRRYFTEVSVGVVAACALALGLATGVPLLLSRSDVYEVPISCGYMLTMLALAAIWCALHEPKPRKVSGWLLAASVAYGLAVGARPNLLFGAVILLVPVVKAWRERRPIGSRLCGIMAATVPIMIIGLGLMFYNALRFDSPFEFGLRYALAAARMNTEQHFSPRYLWFNVRVYSLEPVRWSGRFPFVRGIVLPPLPPGHHGNVEESFGVLSNIPVVWLGLAALLAWRGRSADASLALRWFMTAVILLLGICALTLGTFFAVAARYEVDFLPALVLLAVVGILGLERALAPKAFAAGRPEWRRLARWIWSLLLCFSVAFNLLAGVENFAEADNNQGVLLANAGRFQESIEQYRWALRIKPDSAKVHYNWAMALEQTGMRTDAIRHYEQALQIKPDYAEAHNNLGLAVQRLGRFDEAIRHYEQALRIKPDYAEAHNNLGVVLFQLGRLPESIAQFEEALRINPEFASAHCGLGNVLVQMGKFEPAIDQYQQALRIKPDLAEAHFNLGVTLEQAGRVQEAVGHYQQALRIKPDLVEAQNGLARLRAVQ